MTILPAFKQLLRDMRKQKLRTLMTMFGILWGTMSIILLMGFGSGLHQYQIERFAGLGTNIAICWPGMTSQPHKGFPRGRRINFTEDDVAGIKANFSSVKRISPEFFRDAVPLKNARNNVLARVGGVWPEFGEMRNLIPQPGGRFINALDLVEKRRVIFLGDELARNLFGIGDPVGQRLLVNNVPFMIIGILTHKEQNSSYSGRDYNQAWIPSTTYKTMWTQRNLSMFIAQSHTTDSMDETKKDIYGFLADRYDFNPDDKEALFVWDTTEMFKFFDTFFLAFRAFLVGIGCMTLITGGIGVTNIMNVVLEERTKEIGIKMAVGAKKRTIMFQFLFETLIITVIGGGLGFVMAWGVISAFPESLVEYLGRPTVNIYGSLFAAGALGLIALISGFFPARRAAGLEPVKALKLF